MNFSTVLPEDGGPTLGVMDVVDASCANDGSIDLGINSFNDVASILWNNAAFCCISVNGGRVSTKAQGRQARSLLTSDIFDYIRVCIGLVPNAV